MPNSRRPTTLRLGRQFGSIAANSAIRGGYGTVNYADLLSITLPFNLLHFSKVVVVTSTQDQESQHIAKTLGVDLCVTDRFFEDDAPFNKGKEMNEGIKMLDKSGWVTFADADIILPLQFSRQIARLVRKSVLFTHPRPFVPDAETYHGTTLSNWAGTG